MCLRMPSVTRVQAPVQRRVQENVQPPSQLPRRLLHTCTSLAPDVGRAQHVGFSMGYGCPASETRGRRRWSGSTSGPRTPGCAADHRTMLLTPEDAYGLHECALRVQIGPDRPLGARASNFLVRGRLQNNHKRRLAIVADDALNMEEVVGRGRGGKRTPPVPAKPTKPQPEPEQPLSPRE
jgi:hypothetical protein